MPRSLGNKAKSGQLELKILPAQTGKPDSEASWIQRLTTAATLVTVVATVVAILISQRSDRRQADLVEQGQITDRFSRAVEQIGSQKPDIQIGGAYALDRILRDSPGYRHAIVNVLSAYIRTHNPNTTEGGETANIYWFPAWPPTDLKAGFKGPSVEARAVLEILSARPLASSPPFLNFSRTNLTGLVLPGAYFSNAFLNSTDLTYVTLNGAHLDGADLRYADLRESQLKDVDMRNAKLTGANLQFIRLQHADLRHIDAENVDISNAFLSSAHLAGANLLRATFAHSSLVNADFTGANLTDVNFNQADLTNANFTNANLEGATFKGASLSGAILNGAVTGDPGDSRKVVQGKQSVSTP